MTRYCALPGDQIQGQSLVTEGAGCFWRYLVSGVHPYAQFVSASRDPGGAESIVFDVKPELAQHRVFPIRSTERLAVVFPAGELTLPQTLALRDDFPLVSHINPTPEEYPRSLCLYEERWDELQLHWTVASHIERCRQWLSDNAAGRLHQPDQPVEQIFVDQLSPLILPADFSFNDTGRALYVHVLQRDKRQPIFMGSYTTHGQNPVFPVALVANGSASQQVRTVPGSLSKLQDLLAEFGIDLAAELAARLQAADAARRAGGCVIIIGFPRIRTEGGTPERFEVWAFATLATVEAIGEALGIWQKAGGYIGAIIGQQIDRSALDKVRVVVLDPVWQLTRGAAAQLNGRVESQRQITAIGVGTLGSRVVMSAVRGGFGVWTIIDSDFLVPHNVARHDLTSADVPLDKAPEVGRRANEIYEGAVASSIVASVSERSTAVSEALKTAEVICDMSASLAVARFLATYEGAGTRRTSIFLNPCGNSVVVLCEDVQRNIRLDDIEMQYYRTISRTEQLRDHLAGPEVRIRIARSCRDVTSRVADENVVICAGVATRLLREVADRPGASAVVMKLEDNCTLKRFEVDIANVHVFTIGDWTVRLDERTLTAIRQHRKSRLQNETGGVLIGSLDISRRLIYIIDSIVAPPDSEEYPTAYIRGVEGLSERVDEIVRVTDGQLQYLGEWHSHPDGYSTKPSKDDKRLFAWLLGNMARDGKPAVMCIVGDSDERWFAGKMES